MRPRHLVVPLALALLSGVAAAPLMPVRAAVEVTVNIAPPPLPDYEQPPLPVSGDMWVPGYWGYASDFGYYWVPGTWVEPPEAGLLWTPGYWGWEDGDYVWNEGYWAPTVGYYGGVDYGFGYNGDGFYGGRWEHGYFAYNTTAWNIGGAHVSHAYRQNYTRPEQGNRVSFHGGKGGTTAGPTPAQDRMAHEHHTPPTALQTRQVSAARGDPRLRASANHGVPPVAATGRAGDLKSHPVAATNARPPTPAERNAARPGATPAERNAARPMESRPETPGAAMRPPRPPAERPAVAHPPTPAIHPAPAARPAVAHPPAPAPHPAPAARPAAAPRPAAPPPRMAAPRPAPAPAPGKRPDDKRP